MDNSDIEKLLEAYRLAPGNLPLIVLVVEALVKADRRIEAQEFLRSVPLDDRTDAGLAAVGDLFLRAGDPARALEVCQGDSAPALVVRARAHLALEQHRDGLAAYDKAVAANPALEDRALRKELTAGLTDTAPAGASNVVGFLVIRNEAREKRGAHNWATVQWMVL